MFLSKLLPYICQIPYPHLWPKIAVKNKKYEMDPTNLNLNAPQAVETVFLCFLGSLTVNINSITMSEVWQIMVFWVGFIEFLHNIKKWSHLTPIVRFPRSKTMKIANWSQLVRMAGISYDIEILNQHETSYRRKQQKTMNS